MKIIEYAYAVPSAVDFNRLRKNVGWRTYSESDIENGLKNTLHCILAICETNVVGMVRVVGDGKLIFYIQDLIVLPDFQGLGIGRELMKMVLKFINENSVENAVIGLMSAKGKEGFYEKFGFSNRPNEKLGSGMTIFVEKKV